MKENLTEFDRSGRGFPNFGYRLRKLEQRMRRLEAAVALSGSDINNSTNRRDDAEHTDKETTSEHHSDR